MTADELVRVIESKGGTLCLSLDGQRIRYKNLVGDLDQRLREVRAEVLAILKARRTRLIGNWLYQCCVKTQRGEGNGRILCREFVAWSGYKIDVPEFLGALRAAGFDVDNDGFVHGLILRVDTDAARSHSHAVH